MVAIIDYEDRYLEDFRVLNAEWLNKYGLMESHDKEVLNDPRAVIINGGGFIYLALSGDTIVGSGALIKEHEGVYELAKMSVAPAYRGKGISRLLMDKCLLKAKEIGAVKMILYSNSQLQTALQLYTKYGFQHVPAVNTPFLTADVKMELVF